MPKTEAETPLYEPIASDGTPEKGAGCVPLLAQHKKKALAVALGVACTIGVVVAVAMPHKSTGDAGGSHAPSSGPCGGATCLPTHSSCSKICPGCDTLPCDCPPVDGHAACWPGSGLHNTPDHGCNCFAQLGFCNGTKPEYKPGVECPSCWPEDNHACDCFASLGFCGPGTDGPPFGIAGDFDSFVLARFWDPPAARHDAPVPRTNLSLHGVWPQYDKYMCDEEVLGTPTVQPCQPDKKASGHGWPQYCGAEHATNWQVLSEIEPTVRAHFFAQWAEYAPGYNNDPSFATHEWIKHGTCATPAPPSGEYSRADVVAMQQRYFEMQIRLMEVRRRITHGVSAPRLLLLGPLCAD